MLAPANCGAPALPARIDAVIIGASAGAIGALGALLPALPPSTPWPVVIVVHLPPNVPSLLASLFTRSCSVSVDEPKDKQPIVPGIWFAPADYHLLVEHDRTFSLSIDPFVNFSRPSIDVLFESASDVYGGHLVAVVLTGGNTDGARGATAVKSAGGYVVVEDPATAMMPAMPLAAIEQASPDWVASLADIATMLRTAALRGEP
jgi:two-component system chemotaxis response regulator CheB